MAAPHAVRILSGSDTAVSAALTEITELQGRLDEAREMAVAGTLSLGSLAVFEVGITGQIETARGRLRAANTKWLDFSDIAGYQDAQQRFHGAPLEYRRAIVAALFHAVKFVPSGKGNRRGGFNHREIVFDWVYPDLDPTRQ